MAMSVGQNKYKKESQFAVKTEQLIRLQIEGHKRDAETVASNTDCSGRLCRADLGREAIGSLRTRADLGDAPRSSQTRTGRHPAIGQPAIGQPATKTIRRETGQAGSFTSDTSDL